MSIYYQEREEPTMEKQVRLHVRVKAITINGSVETDSGKVVGTFSRDIPSDRLDEVVTVDEPEPEPEPLAEWERELPSPFPDGLTVSDDGVVLNWRGENYVRQSEPWPTADLIVWTVNGDRGLFAKNVFGNYVAVSNGQITSPQDHDRHESAVPVRLVPVAEFDALKEKVLGFDAARTDRQWRVVVARAAELLMDATDSLGLDE